MLKLQALIFLLPFLTLCLANVIKVPVVTRSDEDISCIFSVTPAFSYFCNLQIQNPNGFNNFTSIGGDHIGDFTNADVTMLYVLSQNTRNFPSIICQQFPNVLSIIIHTSQVEVIDASSFAVCGQLELVIVGSNNIARLPSRTFANNPNLEVAILDGNGLREIDDDVFFGTKVSYIDLGHNNLQVYRQSWFRGIEEILDTLVLNFNNFSSFPAYEFEAFSNLRELDISMNPLTSVYQNIFSGLSNLRRLYMISTGLTAVNPNWFEPLTSIEHIYLSYNNIREIPDNSFDNLTNLETVDLGFNDLTFIQSAAFGSSLTNLLYLILRNNRIIALDEEIIQSSETLLWLILEGNNCFDRNIYNVQQDREQLTEDLQQCYTNFIGFIRCQFEDFSLYTCDLNLMNPVGRDFEEVGGEHLNGRTDDDVLQVYSIYENTRSFPAVICRQFRNLETMTFFGTRLEILTAESFVDCERILEILFSYNEIKRLPGFLFTKNPLLDLFEIFENEVSEIDVDAFSGSTLQALFLDKNRLTEFEPEIFMPVAETLKVLSIPSNLITSLPPSAFSQLTNLVQLDLSHNNLVDIPGNAFRSLTQLWFLFLSNCGIQEINIQWFSDLYELIYLVLESNNIRSIPEHTFASLQHMVFMSIDKNSIRNLHSNSFGNLTYLYELSASGNGIRAFDSQIFDSAHDINYLVLDDNHCVSQNFNLYYDERESVRSELAECFRMFEGFISCEYYEIFLYTCRLNIQNVQGRDDFTEIPGNHLENKTNADVMIVDTELQDTSTIPSVICRQFPNLQELFIKQSFIQSISEHMLEDCVNLELLNLDQNEITAIPDFVFANNLNLHTLELFRNRISSIGPNAFANLQLEMIDLEDNLLTEIDGRWFASMGQSLVYLFIPINRIRHVPEDAFENLQNLIMLDLGINFGIELPSNVFQPLRKLGYLFLDGCGIEEVDPQWLSGLPGLVMISLFNNRIGNLHPGVFDNLPNIATLDLGGNRVPLIHSDSFGSTLLHLRNFYSDHNPTNSIDPQFFDQAEHLSLLFFGNNLCVNSNFYNVQVNRESIRSFLQNCFNNFEERGEVSCRYAGSECVMTIRNPSGHDDYEGIEGELDDGAISDIEAVRALYQVTRIVPRIICDKFTGLRLLAMINSEIKRLTQDSFSGCENLERLILDFNLITTISAGTFRNNRNLREFDVMSNRIHTVESGAFSETALRLLYLGMNRLTNIDSNMLEGIQGTLEEYYLYGNRLRQIPEDSFEGLENLEVLDIGLNVGIELRPHIFRPLRNLQFLYMDRIGLDSLDPNWFATLERLEELHLPWNNIRSLPENIFANLPSLADLIINTNPIGSINSNIFGDNIRNITYINAGNCQIDAIDARLIDDSTNLDVLYLYDNICTSRNFYNVLNDRETVRAALTDCFDNFRGSIECHYVRNARQEYTCIVLVKNIAGHEQFLEIPGNHEVDHGHSDVIAVQTMSQNTRNIPSVICRQFENIERISIEYSRIEFITVAGCLNLKELILSFNSISSIEAGTFAHNPNLEHLDLYSNRIDRIADSAFDGSELVILDVGANQLTNINPAWLMSISETLTTLRVYANQISTIPDSAFENLKKLEILDVGMNRNLNIPSDAFSTLTNLQSLFIDTCNIRNINTQWFTSLTALRDLHLHSNNLRSLPENSFSSLHLTYLSIRNNRINTINSNAFGNSLKTIESLHAVHNRINAIDRNFFDAADNLDILYLYNNTCVSENFFNILENRSIVFEELSLCFENFQ